MARSVLSLSIAQAIAVSLTGMANAATITVNSNADVIADDMVCTLREAIGVANSDVAANNCALTDTPNMTSIDFLAPVGSVNGDVIVMMLPANQDVMLTGALPTITSVVSIEGDDAIIDGGDAYRPFIVDYSGALKLDSVTVQNGTNTIGGGLLNNGTATISNSTFSDNTGSVGGGLTNSGSGTATISNSTFSGNSAINGGGLLIADGGTATISNSTFSGNSAHVNGGGVDIVNGASATISNSTFSGNSAGIGGGGGLRSTGTATISNSVLANSVSGADCVYSTLPTFTNSLIEDGSCNPGAGNLTMMDPVLGSLADNGGPTLTHEPQAGSPLIDAVASSGGACAGSTTDQRGSPRPFDRVMGQMLETDCDIGAVENQVADAVPVDLESFSIERRSALPRSEYITAGPAYIGQGGSLPLIEAANKKAALHPPCLQRLSKEDRQERKASTRAARGER